MRQFANWLKAWGDMFTDTEVPETFAVWVGIWTIASVLRDRVWIEWGGSNIYPNLYITLIGPSGGGKSYPAKLAVEQLRELATVVDTYEGGHTKPELLDYLALLTQRQCAQRAKPKGLGPHLAFFNDEFSLSIGEGPPGVDFLRVMTVLYEAGYTHGTRAHGVVSIDQPVISWLGLTTIPWLQSVLPASLVASGFVSRLVAPQEPLKKVVVPFPRSIESTYLNRLLADLYAIALLEHEYVLTPEAREAYEYWYTQTRLDRLTLNDNILQSIYGREWSQVLKLSMILMASYSDSAVITHQAIENASKLISNARESSIELFRSIAVGERQGDMRDYVLQKISSSPQISHSSLLSNTSKVLGGSRNFNDVIDSLIEEEVIERFKLHGGKWYRARRP